MNFTKESLFRDSIKFLKHILSGIENFMLFLMPMKKRNNISVLEKLEASKLRGGEKLRGKTIIPILIGLLLAICITTPAASAYTVVGNSNTEVVQLYFDYSEAYTLAMWPGYPADVVIGEAQRKGIPVQRTKDSIKTEIRAHAMLLCYPSIPIYRNGCWRSTHDVGNPMDIEMYAEEMWVHLLD